MSVEDSMAEPHLRSTKCGSKFFNMLISTVTAVLSRPGYKKLTSFIEQWHQQWE